MTAAPLRTHLHGQIAPEQEKQFLHLPFTVPEGAARVEIELAYSEQISSDPTVAGGNTLDLGVFDERGARFLQAGFRGWSGSERLRVFLAEDAASPGYTAGALLPGTWTVLLGLYKIGPRGCGYTVDIAVTRKAADGAGGSTRSASRRAAPRRAIQNVPVQAGALPRGGGGWFAGELHCHTLHSDGAGTPAEAAARARANGLDFLAVTDHNTSTAWDELRGLAGPGLLLIAGVEVTTFHGHFNAWGSTDWVDFRARTPGEMAAAVEFARQHGALTSCGHPKPFGPNWDFTEAANYDCVEIWNGPWTGLNEVSLHFWLEQLAGGRKIPAVGGSDYHRPGETAGGSARDLGTPTNWVYVPAPGADESPAAALLNAVRAGRVTISDRPDGPFVALSGGPDGSLCMGDTAVPGADGLVRVQAAWRGARPLTRQGAQLTLRLLNEAGGLLYERALAEGEGALERDLPVGGSRCVYAELRSADEKLRAITNPIYFGPRPA